MAFGLIHWLVSFIIFLVVLSIITWSAVHLGMKDHNSTKIITRFLDTDDYLNPKESNSRFTTQVHNSTSQMMESTDGMSLFANHQGFEMSDSAEFYKILQAFYSMQKNIAINTQDDTTTAMPAFSISNDSSEDIAATVYNPVAESLALDNLQNNSGTIVKPHVPQITSPMMTHATTFFDTDKLRKFNSYRSVGMESSDLLQDKSNGTSNASVTLSFVMPGMKKSDATRRIETTRSLHISQNKQLEKITISPSFYLITNITDSG